MSTSAAGTGIGVVRHDGGICALARRNAIVPVFPNVTVCYGVVLLYSHYPPARRQRWKLQPQSAPCGSRTWRAY